MKAPKIHGVEDHMLEHMTRWNGIGCFVEDFVEQAHQVGLKEESRSKRMANKTLESKSHSDWEVKSNDQNIVSAQVEMNQKTSRRKRKRGMIETGMEKKLSRDQKRLASLLAVEGNKYNDKIVNWTMVQTINNDDDEVEEEETIALQG